MASIRKRVTRKGEARYSVRWRDAAGVEHTVPAGPRFEDARRLRVDIERRLAMGALYPERARAFGAEGDAYLERQRQYVRAGSLRTQRSLWRDAEPLYGLRVQDVRADVVERLVGKKAATAPVRAQHLLTLIRSVLADCERRGLVVDQRVRHVRPPRAPDPTRRYLAWWEVEALADAACHPDDAALILLAAATGGRWGEVCGLTAADVAGGVVRYRRQLDRLVAGQHADLKGGARSARSVPIARAVWQRVAWAAERNPAGPLFPNRRGSWWGASSFRQSLWRPALAGSGIAPCRFHDLRHTCAAYLIEAGTHPKTLQRILGHARIGVTLDTYGHLMPEAEDAAIAALDELLARERGEDDG